MTTALENLMFARQSAASRPVALGWVKALSLAACVVLTQSEFASAQDFDGADPADTAGNRPQIAYDAVGISLASFVLYPSVSLTGAYDSNIFARAVNVEGDAAAVISPDLRITRDKPGQSLAMSANAAIRRYAHQVRQNDERYAVDGAFSYEIGSRSKLSTRLGWKKFTVTRGTFENGLQVGAPLREETLAGEMAATHRFNRLAVEGGLSGERFAYSDVRLDDGTIVDQTFRNGFRLGGTLKVLYDVSPRFAVESSGQADEYNYADPRPLNNRDAVGWSLLAGGRYELSQLLLVQVRVGLRRYNFRNPAFNDISGLALFGRVRWYPTPLLSVRFELSQTTTTSAFDSVSAVTVTSGRLWGDYELRRQLLLSLSVEGAHERYAQIDSTSNHFSVAGTANWKLNRWLSLTAQAVYELRAGPPSPLIPQFNAARTLFTVKFAR